jgi:hypothetical protein
VQVRLDEDLDDMVWRPCLTLTFPAEQVAVVLHISLPHLPCHSVLVTRVLTTFPMAGYRSNRRAFRDQHNECSAAASADASCAAAAGASVYDEVIIIIPIAGKFIVPFIFFTVVVRVCGCRVTSEN